MFNNKLNGKSKDIIQDNISKLKEIFPEIVTEDKIDFNKLKLILGNNIDDDSEKYSFTWPGKIQAIKESQKTSSGTLRPCKEESKNWDSTENLYIEGDNLEVLKLLQKSYNNKIKMIYIDPPYNTGKDFIYSDNYKDNLENYLKLSGQVVKEGERESIGIKLSTNTETVGRYHSNWLNMMYPRLKLARNLLTDDGVIFISISDDEIGNLRKLCDEIYGENNFLAEITRTSTAGSKNDSNLFINDNDYVLVYCKNINYVKINKIKHRNTQKYSKKDSIGEFKLRALEMQGGGEDTLENRPKMGYSIYYNPISNDFQLLHDYNLNREKVYNKPLEKLIKKGYICIRPKKGQNNRVLGRWRWSKEKFLNNLSDVYIDVDKCRVYSKDRKKEFFEVSPNCNIKILNTIGTTEISLLFDEKIFSFPKPTELIKYLLKIGSYNDSIILDFFSGSATTAHANMQLNSENNGNRKFIMVQLPELTDEKSEAYKAGYKNICEIGKERIRRAGDRILEESDNKDLDIGFKVFKLDSSNLKKWDPDYNNLEQILLTNEENIKLHRTELDLIYEIMLKYGIDLTLPIEKINNIYSIGYGALLICLDDNITKEIAEEIIKLKSDNITRVVFKESGFKSDADKTNIKETLRINNIDEFITI